MNPLVKAFILSLLNVVALFLLRLDDIYKILFSVSMKTLVQTSGSHFIILWVISLLVLALTAVVVGKRCTPGISTFRRINFIKR